MSHSLAQKGLQKGHMIWREIIRNHCVLEIIVRIGNWALIGYHEGRKTIIKKVPSSEDKKGKHFQRCKESLTNIYNALLTISIYILSSCVSVEPQQDSNLTPSIHLATTSHIAPATLLVPPLRKVHPCRSSMISGFLKTLTAVLT